MKIPITKPWIEEAEMRAVQEPLRSGWLAQGPYVEAFEDKFAAYTRAPHAIATTSCTTALHLALAACGVGPGDEVVVPAFTWVATANAVEYLGAKPVFCDIDLSTFNIDVEQLSGKVTARTKAVIPVHLFGLPADLDAIEAVVRRHELYMVEDAACGFGTWYRGRHVGTRGDLGCFSFHPRKAITTGEGGMVVTADEARAATCRALRNHGARPDGATSAVGSLLLPRYDDLGYNYRMTDLQGAVGSAQMDRAHAIQAGRAAGARRYDALLAGLDWLRLPQRPGDCTHSYQSYVTLFAPEPPTFKNVARLHAQRNALMLQLQQQGIATRQGTHAVTGLGYYQQKYDICPEDFPGAYLAEHLSLALPLYPQITEAEQVYVKTALCGAAPVQAIHR